MLRGRDPYADLVEERICGPLGLVDTRVDKRLGAEQLSNQSRGVDRLGVCAAFAGLIPRWRQALKTCLTFGRAPGVRLRYGRVLPHATSDEALFTLTMLEDYAS